MRSSFGSPADPHPRRALSSDDPGQDRALAPLLEEPNLLEHCYLPGQLEARLTEFVYFYNTRRYHESLGNLTPADIYFGRGPTILARRQNIKYQTIELRGRLHQQAVV